MQVDYQTFEGYRSKAWIPPVRDDHPRSPGDRVEASNVHDNEPVTLELASGGWVEV